MPNLIRLTREIALADFDKAEIFLDLIAPGCSFDVRDGAVAFRLTATKQTAFHSARRRFRVECNTCGVVVHPATTGPKWNIERHMREVAHAPLERRSAP